VQKQVADKLGIDVYRAAAGVVELFEDSLKNALLGQILGKGYGPESYTLLSYGGGGPLHVGGYTHGLAFEDILVPAWAPGFSAFGCACGDYEYRYDRTLDLPLLPTMDAQARRTTATAITEAWKTLADQVAVEFAKSGVKREEIQFKPAVRMLYYGQLNALEILSPLIELKSEDDLQPLIDGFEAVYGRIYGNSARTPQFGYLISGVVMSGSVPVDKPALPNETECGEKVDGAALKSKRQLYYRGAWHEASILDLEKIKAGNVVHGPAVIEAPASTMVPPGRSARLDRHRIFHMSTSTLASDATA
jgi:acetone carboxylase, beta subunit